MALILTKNDGVPSTSVAGSAGHKSSFARLASGLSHHFRAQRDNALKAMIATERQHVRGCFRIMDLGGRADYWQRVGFDFLEEQDVHVTCLNQTEAELYSQSIAHSRLSARVGNACNLADEPDLAFDMVHSNSVIEHVGSFASKRAFANEVRRLAPAYYVQTPNAWFPIDPHWPKIPMFHWFPLSLRQNLMLRYSVGYGGAYRSVDHAMQDLEGTILLDLVQMKSLFPDSSIRSERLAGLPKSLIAERRSAEGRRSH